MGPIMADYRHLPRTLAVVIAQAAGIPGGKMRLQGPRL
jgi:hypothetical protein